MINVKDAPFLATGDGSTDDRAAIQRAIDYAKNLTITGNAAVRYRVTIYFPAGYYYVTGALDLTNTNGLWMVGDGGSYLNTNIIGSTGGVIFDFSGSSLSGCENFSFLTSDRNSRSTIGTLFALTSNGGLNCGIRNCYFEMNDTPAANGGFGSIGILNIRSEEFYTRDCLVRANTSVAFSNNRSFSETGTNFTASSPFQTLASGTGSMGVVNITGTSLQNYEKRQPAMVLVGTNSIYFQGFLSRISASAGTNETAILCVRYTTNLKIHATIESFSRILKATLGGFDGNEIKVAIANNSAPATELMDFTDCSVKGLNLQVSLPNPGERNRIVLYHAPVGGGTQQANGILTNSTITCTDITDNRNVISANLLRRAENVVFNTDQPFEKKAGLNRQLFNNLINVGQTPTGATTAILRFALASAATINNTNGGSYRIWVDGVIKAGSYGTQASATLAFQAQLLVTQNYNGQFSPTSVTTIILDRTSTNPAYVDVIGVAIDVTFVNGIGSVILTPRIMGTSVNDPITYNGKAELQADFLANDSVVFR
ncbi:hypothetical protein J2I47_15385 [Fibrella sp. HMF5335]|uniref:Rhamnogalacturonase A/B/Epimerase-like pectate lyase domain-containing protein n=1 Tax=Fibrella rubiginis TaxID=2817060 RepID=A0A939GK66_9BACT|nr:glycosyl hydrolase family 28-related protein [Fibrella rubiginis]MBO0937938.1 hypothetical protein [Fibrella rubiginis]